MCKHADTYDEAEDAGMEAKMRMLQVERSSILEYTHPKLEVELKKLMKVRDTRLRVAKDARALRLADVRARSKTEVRTATAQFCAGKAALRTHMLRRAAITRSRPLGSSRTIGRKRARSFVHSLERQGVLRLALAPDTVNADLAAAKLAADAGGGTDFVVGNPGDRVHTARGILHVHDDVVEKGMVVAVWQAKPGSLPKWHGEVVGINRREVSIRTNDNQTSKVFVKDLKNGRFVVKRDHEGNALRNKKL